VKIRKVDIEVLKEPAKPKAPSPRELRRMALEAKLREAIAAARSDTASAVKLILEPGEKFATVRLAFNRVKDRVHAAEVNLHKRGDDLYVAVLAQTRGRRRKGS
jgi:hypothetical protein